MSSLRYFAIVYLGGWGDHYAVELKYAECTYIGEFESIFTPVFSELKHPAPWASGGLIIGFLDKDNYSLLMTDLSNFSLFNVSSGQWERIGIESVFGN